MKRRGIMIIKLIQRLSCDLNQTKTQMRTFISIFLLSIYSIANAQTVVGVPQQDHPFIQVIEWKGKGGLLLSQSSKEYMNQINLTLVGEGDTKMWEQKFNPTNHAPHYIFNEGTNYIYFIDNRDLLNNGRFYFNQINAGGNAKSGTLDIGIKIKRFEGEYDYNKFEFQDATVTDKVLISQYRFYDKKGKEYHEFAMFMTHHNLTHNVIKLGHVDADAIKNNERGQWNFVGFDNEISHFSWRENKTDVNGYSVKGFSAKGELTTDMFLKEPENCVKFINFGYGNRGKYYIEDMTRQGVETGLISLINGEFYLLTIQEVNGDNKLILAHLVNDKWIEVNSNPIGGFVEKEEIYLGSFPINEGITYHYKHGEKNEVGILYFEKEKNGYTEPFTAQSAFNPSHLLNESLPNKFITSVSNGILTCDLFQLSRNGGVTFMRE